MFANVVPQINQALSQHIARLEKHIEFELKKLHIWEDNMFVFHCGLLFLLIWHSLLDLFAFLKKAQ